MNGLRPTLALIFVLFGCSTRDRSFSSGGGGEGSSSDTSGAGTKASSGHGSGGGAHCVPGSKVGKAVIDSISIPQTHGQFGFDLDGDGTPDNQYASVIAAFASQGLDTQGSCQTGVMLGHILHLVEMKSSDAAFQDDACGSSTVAVGVPPSAPPKFDGADVLSVDLTIPTGDYSGAFVTGDFTSTPEPSQATDPVAQPLRLCIGSVAVLVPLVGARVTYHVTPGLSLVQGQINGAIRKVDMDNQVVPAFAAAMDALVQVDPTSPDSSAYLQLFDTGDGGTGACAGGAGAANDGRISACEVASNGLIQSLLAPDVDLYDDNQAWKPNPAHTAPDSFSVGFGFTAVPATF